MREAILADARADAERALADADREASERLAGARGEAGEMLERARARGASEGRVEAARELALRRAQARAAVLEAQRELYEELRSRAREAVLALRSDPAYPELLDRLTEAARGVLGADAVAERDPPAVGGVHAQAGSRSIDYTLATLAERCIDGLGPALRELWR